MSRASSGLAAVTAAVLAASAGFVPAEAAAAAGSDPADAASAAPAARSGAPAVPGPTRRLAWTARIVAPVDVRAAPAAGARRTVRLSPVAKWNGGVVRLLVLESRREERRTWLRVALPDRPNGSSGWIDADFAQLAPVRWRIEVDVDRRRASALRDGRRVRTWPVVVGSPRTPTPRGLFAVYERVRLPPGSVLGPYALHITANSDVLFNYGGGPGRIALHGRAGPLLAVPLGSAGSNGCVRMDSAIVTWLAARAGPGTPVLVR